MLKSKSFTEDTLPIREKWYQFNYSCEKYSEDLLKKMLEPSIKDNGCKLDLPPPNNLLPKNLDFLEPNEDLSRRPLLLN